MGGLDTLLGLAPGDTTRLGLTIAVVLLWWRMRVVEKQGRATARTLAALELVVAEVRTNVATLMRRKDRDPSPRGSDA